MANDYPPWGYRNKSWYDGLRKICNRLNVIRATQPSLDFTLLTPRASGYFGVGVVCVFSVPPFLHLALRIFFLISLLVVSFDFSLKSDCIWHTAHGVARWLWLGCSSRLSNHRGRVYFPNRTSFGTACKGLNKSFHGPTSLYLLLGSASTSIRSAEDHVIYQFSLARGKNQLGGSSKQKVLCLNFYLVSRIPVMLSFYWAA